MRKAGYRLRKIKGGWRIGWATRHGECDSIGGKLRLIAHDQATSARPRRRQVLEIKHDTGADTEANEAQNP
jgi:hypothetical protein